MSAIERSNTRTLEHSNTSRWGFTLLELLVVIAILGILSGVMMATFGGANDSANAAKCMTNLRNLAVAAQNFNMSEEHLPIAGTYETEINSRSSTKYRMHYGWISGFESGSPNAHWQEHVDISGDDYNSHISACQPVSAYYDNSGQAGTASDQSHYAITNGSLWTFVGRTKNVYRCQTHERIAHKKGLQLHWSYVMNAYFGYSENGVKKTGYCTLSSLSAPDRVLLFAEMPFIAQGGESGSSPEKRKWGVHSSVDFSASPSFENDAVLQYDTSKQSATWSSKEVIGFNHENNKKACAHVAFADGHVAKLSAPGARGESVSESKLVELTRWLCTGRDVVDSGSDYVLASGEDEN